MMSETKHTPGPWRLADETDFPWIIDAPADGGPTLTILGEGSYGVLSVPLRACGDGSTDKANFRLMAAAPELYAALRRLFPIARDAKHENFSDIAGNEDTRTAALQAAYDAIRKATEEA